MNERKERPRTRFAIPGGSLNSFLGAFHASRQSFPIRRQSFEIVLEDGSQLCGEIDVCSGCPRANILLVHGLASSCHDPSLRRQGAFLASRGFRVFRLNHRNVGSGANRAKGIYHGGRGRDIAQALEGIAAQFESDTPWILIGQSLSGNMALKLAACPASAAYLKSRGVLGCVAISPIVDLEGSSRIMGKPAFGLFEKVIMGTLKRYLVRVPDLGEELQLAGKRARRLVDIDEFVVAAFLGLKNRFEYYEQSSSLSDLSKLELPCLVVAAEDDPIAAGTLDALRAAEGGKLALDVSPFGGHLGFMGLGLAERGLVCLADERAVRACESLLSQEAAR